MPTYSEEILRLAERNVVPLVEGAPFTERANELCGDRICVSPEIADGIINTLHWKVDGCAILKASAAYLARSVGGKTPIEALNLISAFRTSFDDEQSEFRSGPLSAVYRLPARYKCALLPWQACEDFLRQPG